MREESQTGNQTGKSQTGNQTGESQIGNQIGNGTLKRVRLPEEAQEGHIKRTA